MSAKDQPDQGEVETIVVNVRNRERKFKWTMYSQRVERRYVTRKRMERRAPDGQLLSVTNTRTVHYNDPHRHDFVPTESLPPPPLPRYRSVSCSPRPHNHDETLRRSSVEYLEPIVVRTTQYTPPPRRNDFEEFTREDEYHKTTVVRGTPSPRRQEWRETPTSPRRRVEWVDTKVSHPDDTYEEIDKHRSQERIYFGREETSGVSPLNALLNRINEIRRRSGKRELVPCPKLAVAAGEWAERIVKTGDFRREINEKMCIWRGKRVNPSIVDIWYEEAVEFRISNYINMDWLRTFGVGSAFWPEKNEFVVVVIYD